MAAIRKRCCPTDGSDGQSESRVQAGVIGVGPCAPGHVFQNRRPKGLIRALHLVRTARDLTRQHGKRAAALHGLLMLGRQVFLEDVTHAQQQGVAGPGASPPQQWQQHSVALDDRQKQRFLRFEVGIEGTAGQISCRHQVIDTDPGIAPLSKCSASPGKDPSTNFLIMPVLSALFLHVNLNMMIDRNYRLFNTCLLSQIQCAVLTRPDPLRRPQIHPMEADMKETTEILCIGSVLWDVIGRSPAVMREGSDVPGRITRVPGGVALIAAMTLRRFGLTPVLLTAVGQDPEGVELIAECQRMGLETGHVYRSDDLPTDRYMAVEGANGLIAAIADAHSLEAAGDKILRPLIDGPFGTADAPYTGVIVLDGNLTEGLLSDIAKSPAFQVADLRVAPASPGKAERLIPLLPMRNATIYVNLAEAGFILNKTFVDAETAATAMMARGAARVLVTDGGAPAAAGIGGRVITATPPEVLVTRVTGAGDTFMAAHIAGERAGETPEQALQSALTAAANYVSGDVPT